MRAIQIEDPIFRLDLTVVDGPLDKLRPYLERRFPSSHDWSERRWRDSSGKTILHEEPNSSAVSYTIWLPPWSGSVKEVGVLAHECMHVALHSLRARGFSPSEENDELFCYYLEFLLCAAVQRLTPRRKR